MATPITPVQRYLSPTENEVIFAMTESGNTINLMWDYTHKQPYLEFTLLPEVPLIQGKYIRMENRNIQDVDMDTFFMTYSNDNKTESNYYLTADGVRHPYNDVDTYNKEFKMTDLTVIMPISTTDYIWKLNFSIQMDKLSGEKLRNFINLEGIILNVAH